MKCGQPGDLLPVYCLQVRFLPSSCQKMEPGASPAVAGVSRGQMAGWRGRSSMGVPRAGSV